MKILDACCGSRMFWFNKQHPNTTFMDIRQEYEELNTGHIIDVSPDIVADFRNMPFEDNTYDLVVFDPPHLINAGENSWLAKKYGRLNSETWKSDLKKGFEECLRVLKPTGTLIFKWNEDQVSLREIMRLFDYPALFGNKRAKTHWITYIKGEEDEKKNL